MDNILENDAGKNNKNLQTMTADWDVNLKKQIETKQQKMIANDQR